MTLNSPSHALVGTPHSEDIASCTSSFPQLLGWMLTRIYFSWVPC